MINKLFIKEGFKPLLYLLLATLIALIICEYLAVILALFTLFKAYVYRKPSKNSVRYDDKILSPCDGVVTAIDTKNAKQIIYINLSLWHTHELKAPIDASMKLSKVRHGLGLNTNTYKAKCLNEKFVVKFNKIKIALLSGHMNCQTVIDKERHYTQNERFGIMMQGEIKITLPKETKTVLNIGQKIYAGKTILA